MPAPAPHGRVVTSGDFSPPRWLANRHLQTIWASTCRRVPPVALRDERLETPDGDFVDLVWNEVDGPLVIVLHGLEGGRDSRYARAMLAALAAGGYGGVLLQFRGCGGTLNRLDRSYHSGDTGDLAFLAAALGERRGRAPFAAIGYSLGGNVLLKWLGETGAAIPLTTAVAVSVPFDLGACADHLDRGFSRFYQWRLVTSMQNKYRRKFARRPSPLPIDDVRALRTFRTFDDAVTAPLHGFRGVRDYYARASCRQYLGAITTPTLIIHALDDPFVPPSAIPDAHELSPATTLELLPRGGHVGFVARGRAGRDGGWLEHRILRHLDTLGARSDDEETQPARRGG